MDGIPMRRKLTPLQELMHSYGIDGEAERYAKTFKKVVKKHTKLRDAMYGATVDDLVRNKKVNDCTWIDLGGGRGELGEYLGVPHMVNKEVIKSKKGRFAKKKIKYVNVDTDVMALAHSRGHIRFQSASEPIRIVADFVSLINLSSAENDLYSYLESENRAGQNVLGQLNRLAWIRSYELPLLRAAESLRAEGRAVLSVPVPSEGNERIVTELANELKRSGLALLSKRVVKQKKAEQEFWKSYYKTKKTPPVGDYRLIMVFEKRGGLFSSFVRRLKIDTLLKEIKVLEEYVVTMLATA